MFIWQFFIISGVEKQVIETLLFCKFSSLKRSKYAPQLHKENQLKTGCANTSRSTAWNSSTRCAFLMLLYFLQLAHPFDKQNSKGYSVQ
jgi:hypothetical protein